jgi:hypothetical protein
MPRWNNNPVDVSLGIKLFDDGDYRIKIITLKPFVNTLKEGQTEQSGGVRAVCKVLVAPDSKDVGQTYIANMYQNSEAGRSFSKQLQCPAYGYDPTPEGEEKFDEIAKDLDWTVDVENNVLGEGWKKMEGREVGAQLSIVADTKDPNRKNQRAKYIPV